MSLADYIDLARWLPHPHLRHQPDFLGPVCSSKPDARVTVFHQERLGKLETWLSRHWNEPVQLPHLNPAKRAVPDLAEEELQAIEEQMRWLYAADGHAFGYNH